MISNAIRAKNARKNIEQHASLASGFKTSRILNYLVAIYGFLFHSDEHVVDLVLMERIYHDYYHQLALNVKDGIARVAHYFSKNGGLDFTTLLDEAKHDSTALPTALLLVLIRFTDTFSVTAYPAHP